MANASRYNVQRLLVIGLAFHLIYILSVFDCYFRSPVVHGMRWYALRKPEAKRLVLIVGDGLRADLLFNLDAFPNVPDAPKVTAPHLRSIAQSRGAFGISHTRVPTESRPGHVALIGGMYEDVSAVTKGWKTNPVDFDSVFNQSRNTFSFGSPDILPMFARGATLNNYLPAPFDVALSVNSPCNSPLPDATALDIWVLDRLRELFRNATTDSTLRLDLHQDKTVFFLHLLGLDMTGHSYRPHSKEYMDNIRVVDTIVHETEELFAEFYQDNETSFIFTADHGMSKIGNHGDGDPDNTRTPLIAWGKGIRGPLPDSIPSSHDEYSAPWALGGLLRRDVEQADVAALMAALVGIPWPVNGVGVLPDVDPTKPGYLDPKGGDKTRAEAAWVNAKVILEQYRVKHEMKQKHTLFYQPYNQLERMTDAHVTARTARLLDIEEYLRKAEWYNARLLSKQLITDALEGLRYLQTYDRFLIRSIVTAAYTGFALYSSLYIFQPQETLSPRSSVTVSLTATAVLLAFWGLFAKQKSPWTFYIYAAFPCYFWQQFAIYAVPALRLWIRSGSHGFTQYLSAAMRGALVIATLQGMVYGYTHRSIWTVGFALLGVVWPLLAWPSGIATKRPFLTISWTISCLTTGLFPLLPVDKSEDLGAILMGATVILLAGGTVARVVVRDAGKKNGCDPRPLLLLFGLQLSFLSLIIPATMRSVASLRAKIGLPLLSQITSWIVLVLSPLLPIFSTAKHPNPTSRTLAIFLGFAPCFVILSISVEGLFYVAYTTTLVLWIEVEDAVQQRPRDKARKAYRFQADDLRVALVFLFFVQVAFFGTGNVASISSFYLEPVYRLVPIFNPFLMASLLIFKIVAPYVLLSVTFATLNARLRLPPFSLFVVALSLTDVMTLSFFYNVTDTGSWLEIGQSISFFCITSMLLVWSAGICAAGEFLMADTFALSYSDHHRSD